MGLTCFMMLVLHERGRGTQPQRPFGAFVELEGEGRTQSVESRRHSRKGTWGTRCGTDETGWARSPELLSVKGAAAQPGRPPLKESS